MAGRHDCRFSRSLTANEAAALAHWIVWRDGSQLERDDAGRVIECTAHPDDLADFLAEQRREKRDGGDRLKAIMQVQAEGAR